MGIAIAIAVLCFLILIHEFGHFIMAKLFGIGIIRFSLGFGPVLIKRVIGKTEYAISAIPLGGYVQMVGEELNTESDVRESGFKKENRFDLKPIWQRALIVIAGPAANIAMAATLFTASYAWYGIPVLTTKVGSVVENSPAEKAGIKKGNYIVAGRISGDQKTHRVFQTFQDLQFFVEKSKGHVIELFINPNQEMRESVVVRLQPKQIEDKNVFGEPVVRYMIGIIPSEPLLLYNPLHALKLGPQETYKFSSITVIGIYKLFTGSLSKDAISGPIGIVNITSDAKKRGGLQAVLMLAAIISISLGILNILPIPPLDGGHLPWLFGEFLLGRPVDIRIRILINNLGTALLIALIIFACYNDIARMFVQMPP